LLPVQKIRITHLQRYKEDRCVYLARIGRHSEKKPAVTRPRMRHTELFSSA